MRRRAVARAIGTGPFRGEGGAGLVVGQPADRHGQLLGQEVELVGPDPGAEEERGLQLGQGQLGGQPRPLLLLEPEPMGPEFGRGPQRPGLVLRSG